MVLRRLRQVFRNDCETTALSMALGGRVSQRRLQASLPRARPRRRSRTPLGGGGGDPQHGFVGGDNRAGYGVYERPLLRLARRHAPTAHDLTGRTLTAIVRAIAAGRPVVAWVTLGPSRPISWRTPAGRLVRADAGRARGDGDRIHAHDDRVQRPDRRAPQGGAARSIRGALAGSREPRDRRPVDDALDLTRHRAMPTSRGAARLSDGSRA